MFDSSRLLERFFFLILIIGYLSCSDQEELVTDDFSFSYNSNFEVTKLEVETLVSEHAIDFGSDTSFLENYWVVSIDFDSKGHAWLGTFKQGVIQVAESKITRYSWQGFEEIINWDIAVDKQDDVLIGGFKGLVKLSDGEFTINISEDSLLSSITIRRISVDNHNNAWFACGHSQAGGLVKFDGERWNLFCEENSSLPSSLVQDVACDKNDRVWLATGWKHKDGKIARMSGDDWEIFGPERLGFTPHFFERLELDSEDRLFASLNYVLCSHSRSMEDPIITQFDGSSWSNILLQKSIDDQEPGWYPFTIDNDNNLWLNNGEDILCWIEGKWETILHNYEKGVLTMKGAPDGGIWIGTGSGISVAKLP
jgi:hypothetical protein